VTASNGSAAVLGLDTASRDAAVALAAGEELLYEDRVEPGADGMPRHATALLEMVDLAVAEAGGWEYVGLIAVGVGPGTFTGLRIGVSTARALAQARGLELGGVSSLAALARGIDAPPERLRLALIDARRREVFAALYDASGRAVWEPFVAGPDALAARLAELDSPPIAAGDGSLRFRQELEAARVEVPRDADPVHRMAARHICALADRADRVRPEQVKPIYLRRPDAEIWRERQGHGIG
jgi:tRNA threonylcarbamoyladenosine biosynthesis protein TsaB